MQNVVFDVALRFRNFNLQILGLSITSEKCGFQGVHAIFNAFSDSTSHLWITQPDETPMVVDGMTYIDRSNVDTVHSILSSSTKYLLGK